MPKNPKSFDNQEESSRRQVWRVPIRYKLSSPVLILVLGIVFFVLFTTFNVFRDMMIKHKEARLQTIAEIFSEMIRIPIETKDQRSLEAYIQLLAKQSDVDEVRVEDPDGKTLGNSRSESRAFPKLGSFVFSVDMNARKLVKPYRKSLACLSGVLQSSGKSTDATSLENIVWTNLIILKEVAKNTLCLIRKSPKLFYKQDFFRVEKIDRNTYAAVAPIMSGEKTLGRLVIISYKIEFEKELQKIFLDKFFIALLLVLIATFVITGITWLVMRPLIALQRTARNILAGDLEARAHIHSGDEIQEVGEAFNKVVSRLVQSFEHLRTRTQALEESEEKYRSIVNDVSDIIFSISPEGELMILNRGFSGYTREEILAEGLPLFFLMHAPGEAQKFQESLETIVRTKKPVEHLNTKQFHRLHHAEIYYQTNLTPVVDYEGNLRLIQGVMRDITDLRHIEMMKETFIRDVAHELKTPTAKFIMTTQWLAKQMVGHPEKDKFLPMIKMLSDNADRLMRTISSIMDLSKVESGMSDIKKQELDLNHVLKLVADDTRPLVEQNHLKLETQLSPSPLKMLGDPDMLYRVFVNLITNAIKFTPDGSITVASSLRGNDIFTEVADTGIGIEPENLQRIFEAFFQKTPSTLGIGVGLTISKEIVALHEGEIWAESEGAGQGSVFKVAFPSYQFANKNV